MRGVTVVCCLLPLLMVVDSQKDSKWSWSSNNRNSNIDGVRDRLIDRRKYESLEDFRDRYEVNEHTTRKPKTQSDEFYGNGIGSGNGGFGVGNNGGGYGFNGPNSGVTGNGYNSNGFGLGGIPQGLGGIPQGLGGIGPNNFNNYPLYGNQFNGPYNPGFGYQPNNFKPGFNNNFYPNGGFQAPGYGNGINGPINNGYFPGGGGYGPNRYPGAGYNPLGNSAANGVLVGPGGPTGLYGRPPNYYGPNQLGFNGAGGFGPGINQGGFSGAPFNNGFNNNYGPPYNGIGGGGFSPNGIIPFNSKAGSGILADEGNDSKERSLDKKTNE